MHCLHQCQLVGGNGTFNKTVYNVLYIYYRLNDCHLGTERALSLAGDLSHCQKLERLRFVLHIQIG